MSRMLVIDHGVLFSSDAMVMTASVLAWRAPFMAGGRGRSRRAVSLSNGQGQLEQRPFFVQLKMVTGVRPKPGAQ
jgi:hypothetical protein